MNTQKYFKELEKNVKKVYEVVGEARAKGLDPVDKVEIPLAMSMAEKCVELIATVYPQMSGCGIDKRMLELEEKYGKLDTTIVFIIAEEVAKQKFCKFRSLLEAIDAGIRLGFAYATIGVVASPIEGYTELKIEKTREGKEYFKAYFSGPIRSAGTTASCVVLMLIDYLRELFGYERYDPSEEEIKRYVTENTDYHERVTNLQYFPLEEEMEFLARHLPIQIAGEPTERIEVSNYKNLDRVETNFIRGGMCLIFSEGLAQKAAKGFRLLNSAKKNGIHSTGFDWISEYLELHEKLTSAKGKRAGDSVPVYIKDLVAGRPVFGHPSRSGGFRFRYGRGRVSGFSAVSLHPATMAITDSFIATGTQLKIEKPTKGCVTTVCDVIEGPIVKLINGSVKKLKNLEETKKIYSSVEEIIYLGDILFPFSDVLNRNASLPKAGYVEEWWNLDLMKKGGKVEDYFDISFEDAFQISKKYEIPLHPRFIFYWTEINKEQFLGLIEWLKNSRIDKKIIFPYNKTEKEKFERGKRALELLGVEHEVTIENVVLNEEYSKALFLNLGIDLKVLEKENFFLREIIKEENYNLDKSVLEILNLFSSFEIKDKAGDFIGARMGRPEKAKLRKLTGSPHVLFPVGAEGGRLRSLQAACEVGHVKSSFPIYFCEKCGNETIYPLCENCETKTKKMFYFYDTKEKSFEKIKEESEKEGQPYCYQSLDINHYFNKAKEKLGLINQEIPLLIKGIRGTSSGEHVMENLAKGILRATYDLQVNKDGTIRFDATELPLVSFKPKEISVDVKRLKELGYEKDVYGKDLVDENQILELKPHDILLPSSPETLDERADDVFIKVCNFVDDLLVRFYGLKPFYNVKKRGDLVGKLGVCMAPHNCAGVICRFIGFSNSLGLFASPYMHAAIRRDCDGDEAAIMLLGDVLLNFSRKFLPSHRGGTQDAPLVLNAKINAGEVDDAILDFEFVNEYPLELYEFAERRKHSSEVKGIRIVKDILREGGNPFVDVGFTHNTSDFNKGVVCSSYKLLGAMSEKVQHQMELAEKLRSADTSDTARLIIERHFLRDMRGNLRKFSMQGFRCVACNEIMRRPPLRGVCSKCRGKIIFTIHEGGIKKYLELSLELAEKYNLSNYLKQSIDLTKRYIDSIFGKELEKQKKIEEWF
ncbi:MAG: DNA polymerase II large subunit [archaeon]